MPLAQVDGDIVTVFRTAGAAALGASYLARPDAAVLLIVGSGRIAGLLAQAMRAVRPIRKVLVWNLRAAGAQALAESCARRVRRGRDRGSGSGGAAGGHCQLRHLVHRAAGAWRLAATRHAPGPDRQLQARHDRNRHGLLRRHVRLWDTDEAPTKAGDLLAAFQAGVLKREDLRGTLADLVSGKAPGRRDAREITVFKAVGSALEDLTLAALVYENRTGANPMN